MSSNTKAALQITGVGHQEHPFDRALREEDAMLKTSGAAFDPDNEDF